MKKIIALCVFFSALFGQWPAPGQTEDGSEGFSLYFEEGISVQAWGSVDEEFSKATGLASSALQDKVNMMFRRNDIALDQDDGNLFLVVSIDGLLSKDEEQLVYGVEMYIMRALITMEDEAFVPAIVWSEGFIATAPTSKARQKALEMVEDLVDMASAALIDHNTKKPAR